MCASGDAPPVENVWLRHCSGVYQTDPDLWQHVVCVYFTRYLLGAESDSHASAAAAALDLYMETRRYRCSE